jgi:hypothetical protein
MAVELKEGINNDILREVTGVDFPDIAEFLSVKNS